MKRLVYVMVSFAVIGLAAAGVFTRSRPPDGRALLISTAEAMKAAETVHVQGRPNTGGSNNGIPGPPWGVLGDESYENWYSPLGLRDDYRDKKGTLVQSLVMNVNAGMAWVYYPPSSFYPKGLVMRYAMGKDAVKAAVALTMKTYVKAGFVDMHAGKNAKVTTRSGTWHDQRVHVVVVNDDYGKGAMGVTEFYLDFNSGRLLGLRGYGPESAGKPLVAEMNLVEYGMDIPVETFKLQAPQGTPVMEGKFELREGGNYSLSGPPPIK
jgi:hypothetical protein